MWIRGLGGGALIGGAAALLLLSHGRIAGISGITATAFRRPSLQNGWRVAFLAGLVLAGVAAHRLAPSAITASPRPAWVVVVAGLLVGFGTQIGNGCTSGHGICGLGRGSPRSLAAVMTFMTLGMLVATIAGSLS